MRNRITKSSAFALVAAFAAIVGILSPMGQTFAAHVEAALMSPDPSVMPGNGNQCQSVNGHQICGRFLEYWQQNGGLAQQGLPIRDPEVMTSPVNGRNYTTQRFERAWFELHPENQQPYDVLLVLLGVLYTGPQPANAGTSCQCNAETDSVPVNADDNVSVTLSRGWWDVEDTSCGGPGTGENKCHEFYPLYSDGTLVLPPYSADNGHRRAWRP